jgi:hypothetical protein
MSTKAKAGLALGVLVLIAVIIAVLEVTNVTHFFHQQAKSGTIPTVPAAKAKKQAASKNTSTASNSDKNAGAIQRGTPTDGSAPLTPFGSFVSNHRPNLSGSPAPSQEQSVCNTTPGATCYIQFTQNGVVKKLAPQVANADGVTSWTWDVKTAGFTEGNWEITAIATLNGQSSSAKDTLSLSVQP